MLRELTTPCDIKWKDFPSESNEMVVQSNIAFHSLCAHHVVPFIGHAHIGYIPAGRIVGLSKLARVVKHYSANLTVQEELTSSIADFLEEQLEPEGVAVVMEAEHMCMSMRGVQAPGTKTTTSCMYGAFADHSRLARTEFFNIIQRRQ
jgi:GTP cyclohydrolase I